MTTPNPLRGDPLHPDGPYAEIEAQITELWGHISAASYRFLMLVGQYDEHECWAYHGCCSCAHWLNWRCGIGMHAAREKVRVARALPGLPEVSAAFAAGRISFSKVRALTRIATPENEADLLNVALHGTAAHMDKLVRVYRRVDRVEAARRALAAHQRRVLHCYWDDDGSFVLRARVPGEVGELIRRALEAAQDLLFDEPTGGLYDLKMRAAEAPPPPEPELVAERNAARRADALRLLAEHFLSSPPAGTESIAQAERYQVSVHIDQRLLAEGTDEDVDTEAPRRCGLGRARRLARDTARRLACEAPRVGVVDDENGEPLSVGRKTRALPPAIRRALEARDGGCRFPGCTHERFTEGHHVQHWADGGETKLSNLVTLCRHHHRLIHEGGFAVRRTDDGLFVFRRPDGTRIAGAAELKAQTRPRGDASDSGRGQLTPYSPPSLEQLNVAAGLRIDEKTCRTLWGGERLDYDHALAALMQRRDLAAERASA
jgi:hypothetical protein